jgi:NitT/TauT family transport system ATP-binding protein
MTGEATAVLNSPPSTHSTILAVEQLSKTFTSDTGTVKQALAPVDLNIREGEFVSLVGPSGCGKTTLLKLCAGLLQPSAGRVDCRGTGRPITPAAMGMVFQSPALLPWRSILANVMLPAELLRLRRADYKERAQELLELVQLGHVAANLPHELSGGMQQRASLARALLHDPDILLMDEPFGALDAMTREELNMELQRVHLASHKTILFVTHSISEAVLLSDRIVVMSPSPGRVVDVVDVPLERPRPRSVQTSREFQDVAAHVRRIFDANGANA